MLFSADGVWVLNLKKMRLLLLFKVVLNQATSPVRHFFEAMGKSFAHCSLIGCLTGRLIRVHQVWLLPDVVRHELLHAAEFGRTDHNFLVERLQDFDQSVDILDQNVVSRDHDLRLLILRLLQLLARHLGRPTSIH